MPSSDDRATAALEVLRLAAQLAAVIAAGALALSIHTSSSDDSRSALFLASSFATVALFLAAAGIALPLFTEMEGTTILRWRQRLGLAALGLVILVLFGAGIVGSKVVFGEEAVNRVVTVLSLVVASLGGITTAALLIWARSRWRRG